MDPKTLAEILKAVRTGTMTLTEASKQIDRSSRQEVERRTTVANVTGAA